MNRFIRKGRDCKLNRKPQVVAWFKNGQQMPLTFLLGFYVSLVVKRWWKQYWKLAKLIIIFVSSLQRTKNVA